MLIVLRIIIPVASLIEIITIMKSSVDRDNNYCQYVILQNAAGFVTTLYYNPSGSSS
jgi:hypothetical protein